MFFNLPTLLTWARIVAIPLIVGVFYLDGWSMADRNLTATVLFVVFAATDWADGYLARRWGQTTTLGSQLPFRSCTLALMRPICSSPNPALKQSRASTAARFSARSLEG